MTATSLAETVDAAEAHALAGRPVGAVPLASTAPSAVELISCAEVAALRQGRTVSVCVLARHDAVTAATIVRTVAVELMGASGVVDELVVVHDGLSGRAARVLSDAGASTVVRGAQIRPDYGPTLGRGDLLWRSLDVVSGDVVVWIDGDLENFGSHIVLGLCAPLLADPSVSLVRSASVGTSGSGGTFAVVPPMDRSILAQLNPSFVHLRDAVGGECAARRDVVLALELEPDDGVEIGMLADVAERHGAESIREVDIGLRVHGERTPAVRARQARQIMRAVLSRVGGPAARGALPLRPAHEVKADREGSEER